MEINFKNNNEKLRDQVEAIVDFLKSDATRWPMFTSGSTGSPKQILLEKSQIKASAEATLAAFSVPPQAKALLALPMNKVAGFMMVARAYYGNWRLYVSEPSARPLLEWPKITFDFAALVPYQVAQSLVELPRIKQLIIGGAPIPQQLEQVLSAQRQAIYHTYGMTETLSHVAYRQISPVNQDFFHGVPGVRFEEASGTLLIYAPHLGRAALPTNDMVVLLDDTRFRWLGRKDHVVNSGGLKLVPEQLEKKVKLNQRHFFFGLPDKQWGQALHWLIESSRPLEGEALTRALSGLDAKELPKAVHYLPHFVYTENGKLQRLATVAQWKETEGG